MNARHHMEVLNSFSNKNIVYDKMDLRLLFSCDDVYWKSQKVITLDFLSR